MVDTGTPAPTFVLPNQDGEDVSLESLRGRWVLLYWYPKADTPGCTAQAEGLRDQQEAFDESNCTILGASFDTVDEIAAFRRKYDLTFDLLADTDRATGLAYGVAGEDGAGTHAQRVSFLIDPEGVVRRTYEVEDPSFHAEHVLDDLGELTAT